MNNEQKTGQRSQKREEKKAETERENKRQKARADFKSVRAGARVGERAEGVSARVLGDVQVDLAVCWRLFACASGHTGQRTEDTHAHKTEANWSENRTRTNFYPTWSLLCECSGEHLMRSAEFSALISGQRTRRLALILLPLPLVMKAKAHWLRGRWRL